MNKPRLNKTKNMTMPQANLTNKSIKTVNIHINKHSDTQLNVTMKLALKSEVMALVFKRGHSKPSRL